MSFRLNSQNLVEKTPRQVRITETGDREVEFVADASNSRPVKISFVSDRGRARFIRPTGSPAPASMTLEASESRVLRVKSILPGPAGLHSIRLGASPLFPGNGDDADIIIEC
jgi:hypothetical protein